MRRCFALLAAATFVSLFSSMPTDAAKPETKVAICHVNGANDVVETDGAKIFFGRRIEVAESAVAAHYAAGDGPVQFVLTEQLKATLEEQFGIKIRNADCGFFVNAE